MKFTKFLAAAAISAAFVAAPAQAETMAMADLSITGLFILDANNNPVVSGITITTENRTGTANGSYNGVEAVGAGLGNLNTTVFNTPFVAPLDVKFRCAGPSCGPAHAANYNGAGTGYENDTTTHIYTPTGNYALGDMIIAGNALSGGAKGLTRADASTMGTTNEGSANSTIANSATSRTTFTTGATTQARFALSYDAYVAAFVNAGPGVQAGTLASIAWGLTLTETFNRVTTELLSWTPAEINKRFSSSAADQNASYEQAGGLISNLVTLTGGRTYNLIISQTSNAVVAEIAEIPEPGSMVLVALGLFGLGVASRRKASK